MLVLARMAIFTAFAALVGAQSLDFETYKAKVEPLFLKKRTGHARCVVCHSVVNNGLRLEPLAQGSCAWSEEQSRKNWQTVSKLVKPGDPAASTLLKHPLAPEAGGDIFHSGGRQFESQNDPDWQAIAAWIRSAK